MNMFIVFKTADGGWFYQTFTSFLILIELLGMELVTPPLDGMILPGITRDSVLTLAREHISGENRLANLPKNLIVTERPVTMKEVRDASKSGNLVELFGAGR